MSLSACQPPPVFRSQHPLSSLRACGSRIVDANQDPVRIVGINWFGMETHTFAPHGLQVRRLDDMLGQMSQLGFNLVRLPFSNELFSRQSSPTSVHVMCNPKLIGVDKLGRPGLLDQIVDAAASVGLRILLVHHRSDAGDDPNANGLWHTVSEPESCPDGGARAAAADSLSAKGLVPSLILQRHVGTNLAISSL